MTIRQRSAGNPRESAEIRRISAAIHRNPPESIGIHRICMDLSKKSVGFRRNPVRIRRDPDREPTEFRGNPREHVGIRRICGSCYWNLVRFLSNFRTLRPDSMILMRLKQKKCNSILIFRRCHRKMIIFTSSRSVKTTVCGLRKIRKGFPNLLPNQWFLVHSA